MKSCKDCVYFGYTKENGQHVCRNGKNFDFKRNAYDPGYAERCSDFATATRTGRKYGEIVYNTHKPPITLKLNWENDLTKPCPIHNVEVPTGMRCLKCAAGLPPERQGGQRD